MSTFLIFVYSLLFVQSDDLLEMIQEKYDDAKSIKISFKQETQFKLTDISSETRGVFWFKKEHSYKFETEERVLVTNGTDSWEFNKSSKQVLINDYNESASSPKDFLFSYKKNYHSEHLEENDDIHIIKLFPKKGVRTSDEYLKLWIDEDKEVITRIEQYKLNGNVVVFTIESVSFDEGFSENDFVFSVDETLHHVVDMRF